MTQTITTNQELFNSVAELRNACADPAKSKVGFVPTMGALHEGHLSLVHRSVEICDVTIASIYVNPTQFAANEDLDKYPRPIEQDTRKLTDAGVDLIYMPTNDQIYPPGCTTKVRPSDAARVLEGESRPTHFGGVATAVLKLFNLTGADVAFFGQKDYQQSIVIKDLVRDLNVPIEIEVCPIVRDADGLALSSRNVYLTEQQRPASLSLNKTLRETRTMIEQGETDGRALMAFMTQSLIEGGVTETDYAVVVDADTLEPLETITFPLAMLVAAHVGNTRLLDNEVMLTEPD